MHTARPWAVSAAFEPETAPPLTTHLLPVELQSHRALPRLDRGRGVAAHAPLDGAGGAIVDRHSDVQDAVDREALEGEFESVLIEIRI